MTAFACIRCPADQYAFYSSSVSKLVTHVQTEHHLFPALFKGWPLEEATCRRCGERMGNQGGDGLCAVCLITAYSD